MQKLRLDIKFWHGDCTLTCRMTMILYILHRMPEMFTQYVWMKFLNTLFWKGYAGVIFYRCRIITRILQNRYITKTHTNKMKHYKRLKRLLNYSHYPNIRCILDKIRSLELLIKFSKNFNILEIEISIPIKPKEDLIISLDDRSHKMAANDAYNIEKKNISLKFMCLQDSKRK